MFLEKLLASKNFQIVSQLEPGANGFIYLVENVKSKEKLILKVSYVKDERRDGFEKLIKCWRDLCDQDDHIVDFKDCFFDNSSAYIIMEFCENGDLASQIKKTRIENKRFTEYEIAKIGTDVLFGLRAMHAMKMLHRDIKPGNVLIAGKNIYKLADFDISRVLETEDQQASTHLGTPSYIAPEIHNGRSYSFAADMYSVGALFYELMTLRPAFTTNLADVLANRYAPVDPALGYSKAFVRLVYRLLSLDPFQRPTVDASLATLGELGLQHTSIVALQVEVAAVRQETEKKDAQINALQNEIAAVRRELEAEKVRRAEEAREAKEAAKTERERRNEEMRMMNEAAEAERERERRAEEVVLEMETKIRGLKKEQEEVKRKLEKENEEAKEALKKEVSELRVEITALKKSSVTAKPSASSASSSAPVSPSASTSKSSSASHPSSVSSSSPASSSSSSSSVRSSPAGKDNVAARLAAAVAAASEAPVDVDLPHSFFQSEKSEFVVNILNAHTPPRLQCVFTAEDSQTVLLDTPIVTGVWRWTIQIDYGKRMSPEFCVGGTSTNRLNSFLWFGKSLSFTCLRDVKYENELKKSPPVKDASSVTIEADVDARTLCFFVDDAKLPLGISDVPFSLSSPLFFGVSGRREPSFVTVSLRRLKVATFSNIENQFGEWKKK